MSRDMKLANRTLFEHLELFCAKRGEPIQSAGLPRYVGGDQADEHYLKNLRVRTFIHFGRRRTLSWLTHDTSSFVALTGFEFELELPQLGPIPTPPGIGVCVLSELKPQPVVSPAVIRNVVEVGSMTDHDYGGHSYRAIASLFPGVQVFQSEALYDDDSAWRLFLMACVEECQHGESWIDADLAGELVSLADLNVEMLPYGSLCRSMFDSDPRSLYMALYRCIEATYAFESCRKLVTALSLDTEWYDLAAALESEVGWHPQEAANLNLVLQHALEDDLVRVCKCLGVERGNDVAISAGRAIYKLRNNIVHFRPGQYGVEAERIDWNDLCRRLVGIIFSVFSHAYGGAA